jgi:amidase
MVTAALNKAGHTVKILPPERIFALHRRAYACTMLANVQDGGSCVMKHIAMSREPIVPRCAIGSPASALTADEIFANHLVRSELSSQYNILWNEFGIDAILAPSVAHPANPHGKYISNSYATVYNMLDYVAGCVPVTFVDVNVDQASKEWHEGDIYERIEEKRFPYDLGDKEMKELCEFFI